MLLKSKSSQPGNGLAYTPRQARGPRISPRPSAIELSTVFNGLYMRPNIDNGGVVPATGALCTCPDIWIAGTTPVANFQTALATTNSYATASPAQVQQGLPNYMYVRAQNGSASVQSASVQLYALPCAVIQWPASWQAYAVPTDIEHDPSLPPIYGAPMNNVQPGTIAVAANPFVWANPAPPPAGSDHYCFISWMNTPSNPFPSVFSPLDISALVTTNLGFGWRNVSMVAGTQATVAMQTQLDIPADILPGSQEYYVLLTPKGFPAGWQLTMSCSRADDKGNPIAVKQQNMPTQSGALIGCYAFLSPGFSGTLTVSLFSDGTAAPAGSMIDVTAFYVPAASEMERAMRDGLIDLSVSRALTESLRGRSNVNPFAVARLGSDSMRTF